MFTPWLALMARKVKAIEENRATVALCKGNEKRLELAERMEKHFERTDFHILCFSVNFPNFFIIWRVSFHRLKSFFI